MKTRRPISLWVFALWVLGLGVMDLYRGGVLWGERQILYERGSSLSPVALAGFVVLWTLYGLGLIVSAVGLRFRKEWARQAARVCLPAYFCIGQEYLWLFVRSGLMWERRWVLLAGAIVGTGIGAGALTWRRSRTWLGLG
jgi:hypothetical protein